MYDGLINWRYVIQKDECNVIQKDECSNVAVIMVEQKEVYYILIW